MAASGLQRRKIEVLLDKVEQLPTLPGVACHVLPLVTADRPNRREIQMAIEADASLSARALRFALQGGRPAESLTSVEAVLDAVPLQAMAAHLLSLETFDPEVVREARLLRLWRHILATGMAAQVIATRIGTLRPDTALLAGILHDIGHIAMAALMPKAVAQMLERVEATGTDPIEAERQLMGIDHAVLGKRLAQHWGFPTAIQNVIWLHHQAQVPAGDSSSAGALTQVVRLADLLARQEGLGYLSSEQVRDNVSEVAERVGLSGAHAEQIGRHVAAVFETSARAAGLEGEPSPETFLPLVTHANVRLGQLHRETYRRCQTLDVEARRAQTLIQLNATLAACHSAREVLEAVATMARESLGLRSVVPYIVSREGDYVEGIRCTAAGGVEEHFLYHVAPGGGLEPPPSEEPAPLGSQSAPIRAERVEGWLFERQGASLGAGPFFTVAMTVEQTKVGGLVFSPGQPLHNLTASEAAELVALANMAGIALTRTQAEADLVALSEELAEVNRELQVAHEAHLEQRNVASVSEMAAGAAHEINNPLAIISGRAQQLAADEKTPARRDMIKTIIQQAERISDIITELRLFAQPPAPEFQTVDPIVMARGAAAELESAISASGVPIRVEAPEEIPPIRVDPVQTAAALKEVLRNGLEACAHGKGSRVILTVQPLAAEAAVRFLVTDDGPGMDPQVRARAFDPFYSGYEAGRHRGLGLPKAYRAVQANGGQMALESTPGAGTTVRLTFRAAPSRAPAMARPADPSSSQTTRA